ncbi:MAG TPA: cysteine synthase family protein [Thermoplasmata archaeon]|nr:cysteine synthase family protein [Thermoplasmata archaeon]
MASKPGAGMGRLPAVKGRSVLDSIGRTPLLELGRLTHSLGLPDSVRLLAKAEHLNPGGSGKDRLALRLVEDAERRGLARGGTLVEATSGNTGIGLAIVAAARGYRLRVVTGSKASEEKLRILRALGAEVTVTPTVRHGDPQHYVEVAKGLAREIPGAVLLDQFRSGANVQVHEEQTGPELLEDALQLTGRIDAFVCGVGTGGTLMGVARYLRHASPGTRIILADPVGSVLAGASAFAPYLVEGIGDDSIPPLFDPGAVDESVQIPDAESFRYAVLAARTEGLLVGGSSGCHLAASAEVLRRLPRDAVVATVLADTGRNYLTRFFDPDWCTARGLAVVHGGASA